MKRILHILMLSLFIAGCSRDEEHFTPYQPDEGVLKVALEFNVPGVTTEDVNLYVFDGSDKLCYRKFFASAEALASEFLVLKQETHNIIAVLNCGEELAPPSVRATLPDISFTACVAWLKSIENNHPKMLTGWASYNMQPGSNVVKLEVESGTQGIRIGIIRCTLNLPSPTLPDYLPTRSADTPYRLRVVAEVYDQVTGKFVDRQVKIPLNGRTFDLILRAGNYDIRLWADYVPSENESDYYYTTTDTKAVTLADTKNYTAGSDAKDAFYNTFSINLSNETRTHEVEMVRPFAKYRLVATDVERYAALVANNGYPPLSEAVIRVLYQGFFPSSFNVVSGMPNNADTGVKFVATPGEVTGQTVEIATDYVLVNGSESAVTVTIVLADRNGKEYGRTTDVTVAYRRGYLTTVSGDFLTAGKTGGGIIIDTEWDGEYNVKF